MLTCRNGIDVPESVIEVIRSNTKAPICKVRFTSVGLFDLQNKPQKLPEGAKVGVMCAIAKPDQFVGTLATCGLDVVYSQFLDDHEKYTKQQLTQSAQKAKANGAVCLICTEKDMVKLDPTVALALPIYWLKIEIDMMTPDVWQRFVARHLT